MPNKSILKQIKEKDFKKIYFLHGEEPYFIDEIEQTIVANALEEHERDFNQTIVYGKDADLLSLISELKNYPMMSERRLVVLREAQDFKNIELLLPYCEKPLDSTIFLICYKYKTFDARKKLMTTIAQNGVIFKSDRFRDYQITDWLQAKVKSMGMTITSKACALLVEFLGTELGNINNELGKLKIILPKGSEINETHIEENIGISKDYNTFELTNALGKLDKDKAMKIVHYFDKNPKEHDINAIIPTVYRFYNQLMTIHFLPNKSKEAIAAALRVHPFVAGELLRTTSVINATKVAKNISILHEYDLKAKGVSSSNSVKSGDLLYEMVFKLMN
ncbi:MAG: DNA polymerase III subunit delta [Bacteroidota bacterium]